MSRTSFKTAAESTVTRRKFAVLFLFLLTFLIVYPYAQNSGLPYIGFRIFGIVITVLSVYAVSFRRSFVLFGLVLAIPAIVQHILLIRANEGALSVLSIVLSFVFDVYIVVVIFRRVFIKNEPTKEAIFGALCIYLLLGYSFTGLYEMLATVQPHAFYLDPAANFHSVPDRFDLIYYSFANLTCVGANGITPTSDPARSVSIIESVLGVLYLAVLISRLLSLYNTRGGALAHSK
ncbi:MAG: hypothetical protein JO033_10905 [Acidobacteriaceae bacterium]|nr:hypothetical protein [Acidobacteriaceae bacterium]MBV9499330.1 hypothetical protein [Acidobacteriaceae bacterium]